MSARTQMPVLFDQDCGFCQATARMLQKLDRRGRLELVPFSEARSRGLATELSDDELEASFHAITSERTLSGSDAIPAVIERLPLGALPAAAIRRAPPLRFLVDRAYRFVSRNRHRFTKTCQCETPHPR